MAKEPSGGRTFRFFLAECGGNTPSVNRFEGLLRLAPHTKWHLV